MITVENLLMAYVIAYDAWLDPETERENPTPEYAELIRWVVSAENTKLRELVREMMRFFEDGDYCTTCEKRKECDAHEEYDDDCLMRGVFHARMRELGVEVGG